MFRLVFIALLLLPVSAHADPITLFATVLSATGSTMLAGFVATVVSWGSVIFTTGMLLYGQAAQRRAARAARDGFNASLQDRTISGIATEFPYRYTYGEARVGGNVVALFVSGGRDEYKHIIAVLAQQESESIEDVWLNGVAVGPLDADGVNTSGDLAKTSTEVKSVDIGLAYSYTLTETINAGTLNVFYMQERDRSNGTTFTSAVPVPFTLVGNDVTVDAAAIGPFTVRYTVTKYAGMVRIKKHLGGAADPADATLHAELPDKWPLTAVLRGHTYIYLRLNLNQPEFQSGLPKIEARVKGKKILDMRTGLTAYSDNNALCTYDYLTSELGGVPASAIPTSQFIAAANDCDDIVTSGTWSGKRYTLNGTVSSDDGRDDVLEKMAQSMAGGVVATTWDIYAGKYSAPVMAVTQEDIVGAVAISPGFPRSDIYNTVKGQYVGAENKYVADDIKPYVNTTYLAIDGEELSTDISFPFTNTQQRCTNLARVFTEDNRNGFSLNGQFSLKLWSLRVGQRITFTSAFFGQTSKVYRLTDRKTAPNQMMQLGFKEDAPSIYDTADEIFLDATPNTDLPNPFKVLPLTSVLAVSGEATLLVQADGSIVSRIRVSWAQAQTASILQSGRIEVEYQALGDTDWKALAPVAGSATSAYITSVNDNTYYSVRTRAVQTYINAQSDWTYATVHQAVGGTLAPPAPVGTAVGAMFSVNVAWTFGNTRQDIRATEIWWSATNDRATASRLSPEPFPAARYAHIGLSAGQGGYYWLRVMDTSGNASAWYPTGATAGLYAAASADASALLLQLQNQIGLTELAAELATPITATLPAGINANALTYLENALMDYDMSNRIQFQEDVTNATVYVDPITGQISMLATASVTTDIEARLSTAEVTLNADHAAIDAAVASVSSVAGDLTTAQSQITALQSTVSVGASQVYVDNAISGATGALTATAANSALALANTAIQEALDAYTQGRALDTMTANVATAQERIDATATALASEVTSRSALVATTAQNGAAILSEASTRTTADSALASRATALEATVNSPTTGVATRAAASDVVTLQSLTGDATHGNNALATRASSLEASVNNATTGLATKASVGYVDTAKADAISAAASTTSLVQAQLNTGGTTQVAIAAAQSAAGAAQGTANTAVTNAASAQNTANTAVSNAAAAASTANTLVARLDSGDYAAVKVESSASVNRLGIVEAKHVLKVDANGHVAGMELISNGAVSSIAMLADQFLWVLPDGAGGFTAPKQALILANVAGVPTLGLDGNLIVDGSITTKSITVGAATASASSDTIYNTNTTTGNASQALITGSSLQLVSTGAPVTVMAEVAIAGGSVDAETAYHRVQCVLLCDGVTVGDYVGSSCTLPAIGTGYSRDSSGGMTVQQRFLLPAGTHNFSVNTLWSPLKATGVGTTFGVGSNFFGQYVNIIATENKV